MPTITVSNRDQFYDALSRAEGGDTILLRGGNYGDLSLTRHTRGDFDFASRVTIASADPRNPAVFSNALVRDATNMTFDGLRFDYTFQSGDRQTDRPFMWERCDNLTIRNSTFEGDVARGVSRAADGYGFGIGLSVRNSTDTLVENNEARGFYRGFSLYENADTTIRGNNIHSMRMDGMTLSELDGVLIENNYIHDFRGSPTSGDHCDMIQFHANGTNTPSTDIVIRGNVLDIGNGSATQSIFMNNEAVDQGAGSGMYYSNVLIENNTITNAHRHGISVGESAGLTIRNNSVLHADGGADDGRDHGVEIPVIDVASRSTGVSIVQNAVAAIDRQSGGANWTVRDNAFVQDQNPSGANYYGDVFLDSSLNPSNGVHRFVAAPGSIIDQLNAGSSATQGRGTQAPERPTPEPEAPEPETPAPETPEPGAGGPILSLDPDGHFVAYEGDDEIRLADLPRFSEAGLQLGASGVTASVSRSHVVDVVGSDNMTIAFSLDADRTGAEGELFRLHGSFVAEVTDGELRFRLLQEDGPDVVVTTSGATISAGPERDVVVRLADGALQVWVDGRLRGEEAATDVVGGSGSGSQKLVFGNPWGRTNFNGDLRAFEITVGEEGSSARTASARVASLAAEEPAGDAFAAEDEDAGQDARFEFAGAATADAFAA